VAIAAGHGHVATREFELGLLMLCEGERGRAVTLQAVTLIALVFVGLTCELVVVLIHVAIGATLEVRDLEQRVLASWSVALITLQLSVPIDQRVVGLGMRLHIEQGGLPAIHVVTVRALDATRTLRELAIVFILVAINTLRKRQFLLEVSVGVAQQAIDGGVLSK